MDLPLAAVRSFIAAALAEDVGRGDLTTRLTVAETATALAVISAKEEAVVAGAALVPLVFAEAGGGVEVESRVRDGERVSPGVEICRARGRARTLLSGERLALNLLQQLSGVATLTRRFADAVQGTGARIVDTRKTVPGMRLLQKYAVRVGGGSNHRFGLDDGILIKDNHIAAAGGIGAAVARARAGAPHGLGIEVECESMAEVREALAAGADIILLDNMSAAIMREAAELIGGRARSEASGGIRLDTVRAAAEAGVDLISVGSLTHSAPAVDIHMQLEGLGDA